MNDSDSHTFDENSDQEKSSGIYSESSGLNIFRMTLPNYLWEQIRATNHVYYGKKVERSYTVLEQNQWSDIMFEVFLKSAYLPCSNTFKHARKYQSNDILHFAKLKGQCKSKICENPVYGYVDNNPGKGPCIMRIKKRDNFYSVSKSKNL